MIVFGKDFLCHIVATVTQYFGVGSICGLCCCCFPPLIQKRQEKYEIRPHAFDGIKHLEHIRNLMLINLIVVTIQCCSASVFSHDRDQRSRSMWRPLCLLFHTLSSFMKLFCPPPAVLLHVCRVKSLILSNNIPADL